MYKKKEERDEKCFWRLEKIPKLEQIYEQSISYEASL